MTSVDTTNTSGVIAHEALGQQVLFVDQSAYSMPGVLVIGGLMLFGRYFFFIFSTTSFLFYC